MKLSRRRLLLAFAALGLVWFAWRACPCVLSDATILGGADDALRIKSLPRQCVTVQIPDQWIDANGNPGEVGEVPPYCELRKTITGEYLAKLASGRRYLPFRAPSEYSRNTFALQLRQGADGALTVASVRPAGEVEWEQATYVAPPDRPYGDWPHAEENGGPTVQGKSYPLAESTMDWSMDGMISFDWRLFSVATHSGPNPDSGGGLGLSFVPHPWRHWLVVDFFQLGDTRPIARFKGWMCWGGVEHVIHMNWQVDNIWIMPLRGDHRDLLVCKF